MFCLQAQRRGSCASVAWHHCQRWRLCFGTCLSRSNACITREVLCWYCISDLFTHWIQEQPPHSYPSGLTNWLCLPRLLFMSQLFPRRLLHTGFTHALHALILCSATSTNQMTLIMRGLAQLSSVSHILPPISSHHLSTHMCLITITPHFAVHLVAGSCPRHCRRPCFTLSATYMATLL
jgi:hypothetical protein